MWSRRSWTLPKPAARRLHFELIVRLIKALREQFSGVGALWALLRIVTGVSEDQKKQSTLLTGVLKMLYGPSPASARCAIAIRRWVGLPT